MKIPRNHKLVGIKYPSKGESYLVSGRVEIAQNDIDDEKFIVIEKMTPSEIWNIWLDKNEAAYQAFEALALQKAKFGKPFGFKHVSEVLRWLSDYIEDPDDYKWNNSATTHAGKRFIRKYPQYSNLVVFKEIEK